jgi:phosphatidylserine synthase
MRRRILSFFPNALTVMNAIMGSIAVLFAYYGQVMEAYLMLIGAALFDKLDGALARRLGLTEPPESEKSHRFSLGAVLDDVADTVSFCIAPALIFYFLLSGTSDPLLQKLPIGLIALAYGVLGVTRLIYFTTDRDPVPGFFKGMPTPAAAMLVVAPLIMFANFSQQDMEAVRLWGLLSSVLMVLAAIVMNLYPVRYIHLGRVMSRHPWFGRLTAALGLCLVFTPYFGYAALAYMFLYLLSPLVSVFHKGVQREDVSQSRA